MTAPSERGLGMGGTSPCPLPQHPRWARGVFCLPQSPGAAQVKALVKTQRDSEVLVQRLWHVCAAGRAGMGSRGSRASVLRAGVG